MFSIGDTVALKSGSPTMTVIKKLPESWFRLAWFEEDFGPMRTTELPNEALISSDDVEKVIAEAIAELDRHAAEIFPDVATKGETDDEAEFEGESALTSAKADAAYLTEAGVDPV